MSGILIDRGYVADSGGNSNIGITWTRANNRAHWIVMILNGALKWPLFWTVTDDFGTLIKVELRS